MLYLEDNSNYVLTGQTHIIDISKRNCDYSKWSLWISKIKLHTFVVA